MEASGRPPTRQQLDRVVNDRAEPGVRCRFWGRGHGGGGGGVHVSRGVPSRRGVHGQATAYTAGQPRPVRLQQFIMPLIMIRTEAATEISLRFYSFNLQF